MNRANRRVIRPLLILIAALAGFTSCIDESLEHCGSTLVVGFDYSYNVLSTNKFGEEVDVVALYLFDSNGVLVKEQLVTGRFDNDYTVTIPNIRSGNYQLAAWAKSSKLQNVASDFIIPKLTAGTSTIHDLSYSLNHESGLAHNELNNFLVGLVDFTIKEPLTEEIVTLPFKKVTNKMRVVLLSEEGKILAPEEFDVNLTDPVGNWRINYDYGINPCQEITYAPYFEGHSSIDPNNGESMPSQDAISRDALVSELSFSRLIESHLPRLVITDVVTQSSVLKIDLPDYFRMTNLETHLGKWSLQEYFDRQDEYLLVLTIRPDRSTWVWTTLVINGWVINNILIDK